MPVVAQNRGWKTGDTSHQYEQIFKRTYNHIIEKGQSAVLDPIPEGLGYAYADAYRKGKQDATVDGVSNLKILLAHRIKRFRDIGVRVQIDECETHCRRMAHKWICDVFGAHRALNPRLGQAGKKMLQRKMEQKYNQIKDEVQKSNRWNTFMTDDLRRAEKDCLELITDEESRTLVKQELDTAKSFIGNYWKEERRKAMEKAALEALSNLKHIYKTMDKKWEDRRTKYTDLVADSITSQRTLDKYAADIGKAAGVAVDAVSADNWPEDNQTQFYSKDIFDNYIETLFKMDTLKIPRLMTKYQELGFAYTMLTEYRKKVLKENDPKNKPSRPKAKPKGKSSKRAKRKKTNAIKNVVASIRRSGQNRSELLAADRLFDAVDTNKNNFIEKTELLKALKTNPKAKKLFQSTRRALAVFDHWPEDTKISRDEFVYILHKDSWSNWKAVEGDRENVDWKPFQAKSDAIKAKRDVLRKFKDMSKRLDIDYDFFKGKVNDLKTANELAKLEEEIDDYFNKLSIEINLLSKQARKMFVDLEDNGVGWTSEDYLTQEEFDKIDVVEKLKKVYLADLKRLLRTKKTEAAAAAAEKARREKDAEEKRKAAERARLKKEAEEKRKAEEEAAAAAAEKARLEKEAEDNRKAEKEAAAAAAEKERLEKEAEEKRKAEEEAAAAEKERLEKKAEEKRKAKEEAEEKRKAAEKARLEKEAEETRKAEEEAAAAAAEKARLAKEAKEKRKAEEEAAAAEFARMKTEAQRQSQVNFLLTYTLNFVEFRNLERDRRMFYNALDVTKRDVFQFEIERLPNSTREEVVILLQRAYNLLESQKLEDSATALWKIRGFMQAASPNVAGGDAANTRNDVDVGNVAGDNAWQSLGSVMEEALASSLDAWETSGQTADSQGTGSVDNDSFNDLIATLPVVPFSDPPMPSPLQFLDAAEFVVDADAPRSPPRVMMR